MMVDIMRSISVALLALLIVFTVGARFSLVEAKEHASSDPQWKRLEHAAWKGSHVGSEQFDLGAELVETDLVPSAVEGHWLRAAATTDAQSPDFNVWIHMFDARGYPVTRPLPTSCSVVGNVKRCTNATWVVPGASRVRVAFYPGAAAVVITPGAIELASADQPSGETRQSFHSILDQLRQTYYRASEVDWSGVEAEALRVLAAPLDIDPLPVAIAVVVGRLPGNKHSFVFPISTETGSAEPALPTCSAITRGQYHLAVPGTPRGEDALHRYVARAHDCLLQHPSGLWIVDLRDNGGGDLYAQLAALAPLLGRGPQLRFSGADGTYTVAIERDGVRNAGTLMRAVPGLRFLQRPRAVFLIGKGCMSSCEAIAISAGRRFKRLGGRTGGFATANETIHINAAYSVAVTAGIMTDLEDHFSLSIAPDVPLDEYSLERVLQTGWKAQ